MTGSATLVLPLPPSANRMYRAIIKRGASMQIRSKEARAYEEEVGKAINAQGRPEIPDGLLAMHVVYRFPQSRKGADTDNLAKALIDGIARTYGFDDARIRDIHAYRRYTKSRKRCGCTVVFTPCDPVAPIGLFGEHSGH